MPTALREAGAEVRTLADEFKAGTKDVDWLTGLHGHDWIVLTKDKNIRRRPLEIDALIGAGLRVFVVTATDLTGEETGQIIVKALPKIRRLCKRQPAPFIAGITRMSDVTLFENPRGT